MPLRIKLFCHSIVSDWNHGNAHFLRGICLELQSRGHEIDVYEPVDSWSRMNLLLDRGARAMEEFQNAFPALKSELYDLKSFQLEQALESADLVIVHEWNDPELVARIGYHHKRSGSYVLLFHDTHHRALTAAETISRYDLSGYDGVLAFGKVICDIYKHNKWAAHAWTWHEAADVRTFYPRTAAQKDGDLIWIGNWGDDERTEELMEFLIEPVRALKLKAVVHGVRYPEHAIRILKNSGIEYRGYLPNFKVPEAFAAFRMTIHVPRRPYARVLAGIPTIRPFEAMACGIPLVSAPWDDCEGLFRKGTDLLYAENGDEMKDHLDHLMTQPNYAVELKQNAFKTLHAKHTCAHRIDQLLEIFNSLNERASLDL